MRSPQRLSPITPADSRTLLAGLVNLPIHLRIPGQLLLRLLHPHLAQHATPGARGIRIHAREHPVCPFRSYQSCRAHTHRGLIDTCWAVAGHSCSTLPSFANPSYTSPNRSAEAGASPARTAKRRLACSLQRVRRGPQWPPAGAQGASGGTPRYESQTLLVSLGLDEPTCSCTGEYRGTIVV